MQYEFQGTLARLAVSPYRQKRALAVTAKQFGEVLRAVKKSEDAVLPDSEAVRFYALNQLVSQLFQHFTLTEKLPTWAATVVSEYEQELRSQHRRMVWYTFLVISREFRHLKNPSVVMAHAMYSQGFKTMQPSLSDSTEDTALGTWLALCPPDSLADYCKCLTYGFDTGSWSGGYGGKPWGMIARTLGECMAGNTSPEIFIDTAYTLAHNNGPMFNKGMFYQQYTMHFKTLLDVQRSGQVCEGLLDGTIQGWFTTRGQAELLQMVTEVRKNLGGVNEHLDWYKVEALGSMQKYPKQKAAQDKKYGKKAENTLINGQPVKLTGFKFEVLPNEYVPIYQRLATA